MNFFGWMLKAVRSIMPAHRTYPLQRAPKTTSIQCSRCGSMWMQEKENNTITPVGPTQHVSPFALLLDCPSQYTSGVDTGCMFTGRSKKL